MGISIHFPARHALLELDLRLQLPIPDLRRDVSHLTRTMGNEHRVALGRRPNFLPTSQRCHRQQLRLPHYLTMHVTSQKPSTSRILNNGQYIRVNERRTAHFASHSPLSYCHHFNESVCSSTPLSKHLFATCHLHSVEVLGDQDHVQHVLGGSPFHVVRESQHALPQAIHDSLYDHNTSVKKTKISQDLQHLSEKS